MLHFQTQVTTHFDIPVDVTMLMQVIKSLESLLQDSSNHRLLKTIWKSCLHDMYTWPTSHVWHHNPKTIFRNEGAIRPQDIRMTYQAHCCCFCAYLILHTEVAIKTLQLFVEAIQILAVISCIELHFSLLTSPWHTIHQLQGKSSKVMGTLYILIPLWGMMASLCKVNRESHIGD